MFYPVLFHLQSNILFVKAMDYFQQENKICIAVSILILVEITARQGRFPLFSANSQITSTLKNSMKQLY